MGINELASYISVIKTVWGILKGIPPIWKVCRDRLKVIAVQDQELMKPATLLLSVQKKVGTRQAVQRENTTTATSGGLEVVTAAVDQKLQHQFEYQTSRFLERLGFRLLDGSSVVDDRTFIKVTRQGFNATVVVLPITSKLLPYGETPAENQELAYRSLREISRHLPNQEISFIFVFTDRVDDGLYFKLASQQLANDKDTPAGLQFIVIRSLEGFENYCQPVRCWLVRDTESSMARIWMERIEEILSTL